MIKPKKIAIITSLIIFMTIAAIIGLGYYHSFQKIKVTLSNGIEANIYKEDSHEGQVSPTSNLKDPVNSIRLKKGNYYIKSKATSEYVAEVIPIQLSDKPVSITINPDYTQQKLDNLLGSERSSIDRVITQTYNTLPTYYTIQKGKLYMHGEWYATKLIPKNSNDLDSLSIILHKDKNNWTVATKPPEIIIGIPNYPAIPKDIIRDVNNFL